MLKEAPERWLPIPGTNDQYSVSSEGRVRSEPTASTTSGRQRGRVLSPTANRKGYLVFRVCLSGGVRWQTRVHQVVAAAFIGARPDGMQVNHKDGDKRNNRPDNLEYATCLDNIRHCWANGLHTADHCRGTLNNKAKLSEDDVRTIRAIYPAKSLRQLASMFGVSVQNIACIVKRKTWAHVV